jgi:hypothetical protein
MVDSAFYTAPFFVVAVLLGSTVSCCLARRNARELRVLEARVEQLEARPLTAAAATAPVYYPVATLPYAATAQQQFPREGAGPPPYNQNAPRMMSPFVMQPRLQATAPV